MRFRREAQVLAALNHPNIATVFSLEEERAMHFITMEYVVGKTLARCIEGGLPAPDLALSLGRQLALALEAAHRQGVIHRDLKPSNIMVTPENMVKVLDFGIAKVVASSTTETGATDSTEDLWTSSGSVLGTVGYMSPEQLRGRPVDNRSDIWAFGCCLYECLAGRQAFEGETPPERMAATMEREPRWETLVEAPSGVQDLLKRCLEKDPQRRLADISDAIAAIDQSR
jgi:serine/threonine-protein kinase